jgi:hypothetical protein
MPASGMDPDLVVEQIDLSFRALDDMEAFLQERGAVRSARALPDRAERIVLAQILENTYTAIETALLRISQGFDNILNPDRWHADLLDKMLLEKKSVRPRPMLAASVGFLAAAFLMTALSEIERDETRVRTTVTHPGVVAVLIDHVQRYRCDVVADVRLHRADRHRHLQRALADKELEIR